MLSKSKGCTFYFQLYFFQDGITITFMGKSKHHSVLKNVLYMC